MLNFFLSLSKPLRWTILTIVSLQVICIFSISPIAKYIIEKNSKEWTGRTIMMEDLGINIFTGGISVEGLQIFEKNDKHLFISAGSIKINNEILKIITGNYAITSMDIDSLNVNIIHDNEGYNFDDLIQNNSSSTDTSISAPVRFELHDLTISNSRIVSNNTTFQQQVALVPFNFYTPGLSSESKQVIGNVSFGFGKEGHVKSDWKYKIDSGIYDLLVSVTKLDLSPLDPFIKDVIHIDEFGGDLNCDLIIRGNAHQPTDIALSGTVQTDNVFMIGPKKDTLLSVGQFRVDLDTIDLKHEKIDVKQFIVSDTFLEFEMHDNGLNNFTMLMGADSSTADSLIIEMEAANPFTLISEYSQEIRKEYEIDNYAIDSFSLNNGRILFKDFTLNETFVYDITKMDVWSGNFNSANKMVTIEATALLNGRGQVEALYAFDPNDMLEMDLYYRITDMSVTDMSPYSRFYVAHPFREGALTYESTTTIRNKILKSDNKILVKRIQVGSKTGKNAVYDMPLKLAVALLKNSKGDIDLDLPVDGDLNDPNYHVGRAIWNVIKNLLVKVVTAPYRLLANSFGVKEEDLRELPFDYTQQTLDKRQLKQLDPLTKILEDKPELTVSIAQLTEPALEEEEIGREKARRMYYYRNTGIQLPDSLDEEQQDMMDKIHIKDSSFVAWTDSILGAEYKIVPIQEKVILVSGKDYVKQTIEQRHRTRNTSITNYLVTIAADTSRIKVFTEQPDKIQPSETRSKYLIEFGVKD